MQKALDQMNLRLHHVLSTVTGLSGIAYSRRDSVGRTRSIPLAKLCHRTVKTSRDTVAKVLEGDYKPEHLFALR